LEGGGEMGAVGRVMGVKGVKPDDMHLAAVNLRELSIACIGRRCKGGRR